MANKEAPSVRKSPPPSGDPRSHRSRVALGNALVALMLERNFDDISVQQVLDRAKVGRATFYAHFRNKHDLLLSDAERFLEMLEAYFLEREAACGGRRVAPVAELFSHVADYDAFQRALASSGLRETVYDLVAGHLARLIERRIAALRPGAAGGGGPLSLAATSRVYAGALVELLRWWMERPSGRPGARQMDEHFHDIVWRGLEGGGR